MPLGNRLTTPQTDWGQTSGNEDFIRQAQKQQVKDDRKAARQQMKKSEREAMAQGLVEDPEASTRSEEDYNARNFGFDPAPDNLPYSGSPGINLPGIGAFPPIQPGAVDPQMGFRQLPDLHPLLNPHRDPPTPPVAGSWDPLTGEPHTDPQYEARLENWKRYQRERKRRGGEPATKVWSAPIGPMFGPGWRPPQPPG